MADRITVEVDDGFSRWTRTFTEPLEAARYVAGRSENMLFVLNDIRASHRWTKAELIALAAEEAAQAERVAA